MRLVTLTCRMRHLALWWGPFALVVIWPLWLPRPGRPYSSLTTARQSGGTFVLRVGPLLILSSTSGRTRRTSRGGG